MRLLDTTEFTLEEFFDSQVPQYCILSHRWYDDEILLDDVKGRNWKPTSESYKKVTGACQLAADRGFKWIWIDTCCIDKASSAELTEAINSMFNYYARAKLCIAYLSDVRSYRSRDGDNVTRSRVNEFRTSAWFTRGWTLQELLAPGKVEFFNREFEPIGNKAELSRMLSEITGIDSEYLDGTSKFNKASVATRMSWASERKTTRVEDQAYSLLGIFGVYMPLLYGEGNMAFFRLQQQIIQYSNDETIFAWTCESADDNRPYGMLAESLRDFRRSAHMRRTEKVSDGNAPFGWRNGGVEFSQGFTRHRGLIKQEGLVALACKQRLRGRTGSEELMVAIWLRKMEGVWYRFFCKRFYYVTEEPHAEGHQTFYIPQPNLLTTPSLQYEDQDDVIAMVRDRIRSEQIALTNAMAKRAAAEADRAAAAAKNLRIQRRADEKERRVRAREDAEQAKKSANMRVTLTILGGVFLTAATTRVVVGRRGLENGLKRLTRDDIREPLPTRRSRRHDRDP